MCAVVHFYYVICKFKSQIINVFQQYFRHHPGDVFEWRRAVRHHDIPTRAARDCRQVLRCSIQEQGSRSCLAWCCLYFFYLPQSLTMEDRLQALFHLWEYSSFLPLNFFSPTFFRETPTLPSAVGVNAFLGRLTQDVCTSRLFRWATSTACRKRKPKTSWKMKQSMPDFCFIVFVVSIFSCHKSRSCVVLSLVQELLVRLVICLKFGMYTF